MLRLSGALVFVPFVLALPLACQAQPASSPARPAEAQPSAAPVAVAPKASTVPDTALAGPPLDPQAVAPGTGWVCFQQDVNLFCERDLAGCEARFKKSQERDAEEADEDADESESEGNEETSEAEREAAKQAKDNLYLEACLVLSHAWCMTVRWDRKPEPELVCFTNQTTCLEDGNYYRGRVESDAEDNGAAPPAPGEEAPWRVLAASGCAALK